MKKRTRPPIVPRPLARVARFEKLGFGLFLHWGPSSLLGRGEWIQDAEKIPRKEYAKLISRFSAEAFDPRAIARLARESGMRYITLITRHHDGFSLYDTRGLSKFDAPHSAAARDLVAEFADACRAEGVIPFFYHTTLDWRFGSKDCSKERFNEYLDYLHASVEILCRHYGKIGGMWFDGNWSREDVDWKEDRLYGMIRKYQPEAIIINNTGLGARGAVGHPELDSVTFEQGLPSAPDRTGWPKYLAAEMCETMNGHWGIGRRDFRFKSPADVIERLCACRKTGANYLLNVGPNADGSIPDYEAAVLRMVGRWIKIHGTALYEARPDPAWCGGRDFILRDKKALYYFAFNLGRLGDSHVVVTRGHNGLRPIEGLSTRIGSAVWMDNNEEAPFIQSKDNRRAAIQCDGYYYGDDLVVRVAKLIPA